MDFHDAGSLDAALRLCRKLREGGAQADIIERVGLTKTPRGYTWTERRVEDA